MLIQFESDGTIQKSWISISSDVTNIHQRCL